MLNYIPNIIKYTLLFLIALISINSSAQSSNIQRVDSIFSEWNGLNNPGGAIAVIQDGKLKYSKGYGSADLEHDISNQPSSVFYIASESKQFVAFCILLLEEQGKLSLDDRIQKHLPDFPEYGKYITIRHLIHHISGIRSYGQLLDLKGYHYLNEVEANEVYNLIKSQKGLSFPPGERHQYSNSGYFLLGKIVEKVSGKSLKDFAHEHIFQPLGMKNTLFWDDNTELIKNKAFSYAPKENTQGFENLIFRFDLVGSGGIYSTVEDLASWVQNYQDNKLGKGGQSIINQMYEEGQLNSGEGCGYSFGLMVNNYKGLKTVSHGGGNAGYRSFILRFPDENFAVIILSNRSDGNPNNKAYQVAELYLKEQFETPEEIRTESISDVKAKTIKIKSKILETYEAFYWNDQYGLARRVYLKNDTLRYWRSEMNESNILPVGKDEFRMTDNDGTWIVKFETIEQKKTMTLTLPGTWVMNFKDYIPSNYSTEELKLFEGIYHSDELDLSYQLRLENETLIVYRKDQQITRLRPFTHNEFLGEYYLRFQFNWANGNQPPASFNLSTGRADIVFERK